MYGLVMIIFLSALSTITLANGASIDRIIGGSTAPDHSYPYQVSFRQRLPGIPDFHFCSGSILNEKWILTAAHCFQNRKIENVVAVAATNRLSEEGESYKIHTFVIHKDYKTFYHDDICLVCIRGSIKFGDDVKSIALPEEDIVKYDVPATFAGWGSTVLGGPSPDELQHIELKVISNEECVKTHPITGKHVCTFTKYAEGICHGDSGGPLVIYDYQVGIASYVNPCAIGYPDVYTRVFPYVKWIHKVQQEYGVIF